MSHLNRLSQSIRLYATKQQPVIEEKLSALGPFTAKRPLIRLPNVEGIHPNELNLQNHPRRKRAPQTLLRSIDFENQLRYDADSRAEMFLSDSPNRIQLGSILLIDKISSRSSPQKRSFAGVLLAIRRKGVMSNIVLRSVVMGTGVEMVIPIFSPMITKISVLKEAPQQLKDLKNPIFWVRENPENSGIDFNEIENIVIRYKNQQLRDKNAAEKIKG